MHPISDMGEVSLDLIHYDAVVDEEVSSFNRRTFQPFVSFKKLVIACSTKKSICKSVLYAYRKEKYPEIPPNLETHPHPTRYFSYSVSASASIMLNVRLIESFDVRVPRP